MGSEESYALGPANGSLRVHTTRQGVAAKVGHDLVIEVSTWEATLTATDPPAFELTADGRFTGSATVVQSQWGIKPYTGLMGALKVADPVEIRIEGRLPG